MDNSALYVAITLVCGVFVLPWLFKLMEVYSEYKKNGQNHGQD